jgi:hypothetical protein
VRRLAVLRGPPGLRRLHPLPLPHLLSTTPAGSFALPEAFVGRGSAIFLHVNGAGSTAGCVSVTRPHLIGILRWLNPAARPRIVLAPLADIGRAGNTVDRSGVGGYRDRHVRARSAAALFGGSRVRSSASQRRRYSKLTLPHEQQNPGEGWLPHARFWRSPPGNGLRTSQLPYIQ